MEAPLEARRVRRSEFAGTGNLIQLLGLVLLVAGFVLGGWTGGLVGLVIFLACFLQGSAMSVRWTCGNCHNPIHDREVTVCPACHARLT